ncbi:MAG: BamA/TamA family outer membrane protein [Bacteroidaceae bacterium]|nr:BamA/TamA family outer membrane protein [Bacteroidaceae bacterium]
MLARVSLKSDTKAVNAEDYRGYVRQEANSRWFNLVKVPLGIYSLSRADTAKRGGRLWKRLGEAPVVYDSTLTAQSAAALRAALRGHGWLHGEVGVDETQRKRRARVHYQLQPGDRWIVDSIAYEADDSAMLGLLRNVAQDGVLRKGMPLDVALLSQERERIVTALQNMGYYALNKEYLAFIADTLAGSRAALLHVVLRRPDGTEDAAAYRPFTIRRVDIYENMAEGDTGKVTRYRDLTIHYRDRLWLNRHTYSNHVALRGDKLFGERDVRDTYSSLNGLQPVGYTTVRLRRVSPAELADTLSPQLDAQIVVSPTDRYTVSAEADGTNTNGDFGAALSLTFSNRNTFHGGEVFSLKLRGAYEAIKGLEGYGDQNYTEYSVESRLRLPAFKFPFVPRRAVQNLKAVSELGLMYNSQDRPEFHRRVLTARWAYTWTHRAEPRWQHTLDVLNLNYVFLPWISETFRTEYLEGTNARSSILRNTYENLLIMRIGYNAVFNSRGAQAVSPSGMSGRGWQLRINAETAGNLLYTASRFGLFRKDESGQYEAFGIPFSQYAKIDLDYAASLPINDQNSLALHALFGLAMPYGNSLVVPYEKRYFAGGANSVRGWSVRELGPGGYHTADGKVNFVNQTGNLQMLLSLEYRTHLFWKFNGAAFVDAGNTWNTRRYADIPDSRFKFGGFWKQIAVAYGIGLRFNLDYFILRFDAGMKAINPAVSSGREHYPIVHPKFSRDFALHFAVGLPF